jgi:hypothetical protein
MPEDAPTLRTPDGRYIVVRGRLWRSSNPALGEDERQKLVDELMDARRAVKAGKRDKEAVAEARHRVNLAKIGLGERGPVWWSDGSPDLNRHKIAGTIYADWYGGHRERK